MPVIAVAAATISSFIIAFEVAKTLVYRIPMGLWYAGCFVCTFIRQFFILVHSRERLLCGCWAAATTAAGCIFLLPASTTPAGYAIGAVMFALIGATLGVADYQLVSIRWLKLVHENGK